MDRTRAAAWLMRAEVAYRRAQQTHDKSEGGRQRYAAALAELVAAELIARQALEAVNAAQGP